jgi:hypothetical protein
MVDLPPDFDWVTHRHKCSAVKMRASVGSWWTGKNWTSGRCYGKGSNGAGAWDGDQ